MPQAIRIAPSLPAADFARLGEGARGVIGGMGRGIVLGVDGGVSAGTAVFGAPGHAQATAALRGSA